MFIKLYNEMLYTMKPGSKIVQSFSSEHEHTYFTVHNFDFQITLNNFPKNTVDFVHYFFVFVESVQRPDEELREDVV